MGSLRRPSAIGPTSTPFPVAPESRDLYLGAEHGEALAHLLYGLDANGGFVVLSGAAGTGKTSVCRCVFEAPPSGLSLAYMDDPGATIEALTAQICQAFGLERSAGHSVRHHVKLLEAFLLENHAKGRRSVLVVDEAQRLSATALEQLRLLTNLETNERKLLQIVLVGRPELRRLLAQPELRQLGQRVVARFHLTPLARREVMGYVKHRLAAAGGPADALPRWIGLALWALSGGNPRRINLLCDRALRQPHGAEGHRFGARALARAAAELVVEGRSAWSPSTPMLAAAAVVVAAATATMATVHFNVATPAMLEAAAAPSSAGEMKAFAAPAEAAGREQAGVMSIRAEPDVALPKDFAWPSDATRERSVSTALAGMMQRWEVTAGPGIASGCAAPLPNGLRCLQGRAGMGDLRAMDLPVVLHLYDDARRRADALLLGIERDQVRIRVAESEQRVTLKELAAFWRGDYTMLWKPPPAFTKPLRLGDSGPAVQWLGAHLARWRGENRTGLQGNLFDKNLLRDLRNFQVLEDLDPDGVAGVKTLARLASRTDRSAPALTPAAGA